MIKFSRRIARFSKRFDTLEADGIVFLNLADIRYLSGFEGYHGAILWTPIHKLLLTDFTHYQLALQQARNFEVRCLRSSLIEEIAQLSLRMGLRSLAFHPAEMTYADYTSIRCACPRLRLAPIRNPLTSLRQVKEKHEIRIMKRAASHTDFVFERWIKTAKPGISESALERQCDLEIRSEDPYRCSFDIMVLSGYRTSQPHARTSSKKIARGDLLLIDFGVSCEGYKTDCTRTVCVGHATPRQKKIYKVILSALYAAMEKIKPGVEIRTIANAAREVIIKENFGDYFQHPLGHGIGLSLHEEPFITEENQDRILPGMVFTLEPGIYIPGWGGIRIEDMVIVDSNGANFLTNSARNDLLELGLYKGGKA
jgi:Xaa-Pro aminopeptidase